MKRNAGLSHTLSLIAAVALVACDDGAPNRIDRRSAEIEEDTSAGVEVDELVGDAPQEHEPLPQAIASEREPGDGAAPPSADALQAPSDPQEGLAPACDIAHSTINTTGCEWQRDIDSSGFNSEVFCSFGTAVSGGCYTSDFSHMMVRNYPAEASQDVIDDGQPFEDATGWHCAWDTEATGGDTHSSVVLCCATFAAAICM